jgi:hypothetical protein
VIIDEAAHVDPDLFFKVIAPILQLRNTALLALSSPEGDSNYYSQFISMAEGEEGEEPLFKVVDCILMCDDCKKLERADAVECNHVKQVCEVFFLKKRNLHVCPLRAKTGCSLAFCSSYKQT